jgi:WS/DGAT/MGAT family acyltransferase
MDLADIKALRRELSGTLNDVVLTVVTGAVRRFLQRRQVDPRGIEFRVLAPVSVRTEDERGTFGNRVSAWMVDLPIGEPDPRKQIERIARRTAELKESKHAVGAEVLTQVAEWTPSALLSLGARNVTRLLPFNMVVTNVPGPQIPMYMLGARMLEVYPHVPLTDNLGLGIALLSYDGKLYWGFNADYDLVPDLSGFVDTVRESFEEIRRLVHGITPAAEAKGTQGQTRPRAKRAGKPAPAREKRTNGPTASP